MIDSNILKHSCIRSVPHTGTHFIRELLESHGIKLVAHHFWDFMNDDFYSPYTELKICPIRDPSLCYVTFVSRDKDLHNYWAAWRLFNELYEIEDNVYIVPVDTPDRDTYLQQLSLALDVNLETDWKPVAREPRKQVDIPDLTEIYQLPVVKKFYDDIVS